LPENSPSRQYQRSPFPHRLRRSQTPCDRPTTASMPSSTIPLPNAALARSRSRRPAVSAALKVPSHTNLPNGHPKFAVFRREAATKHLRARRGADHRQRSRGNSPPRPQARSWTTARTPPPGSSETSRSRSDHRRWRTVQKCMSCTARILRSSSRSAAMP